MKLYDIQCIFNVLKSLYDQIAITIKTDTNVNPWGFSRKFLDKLAFSNPNDFEKSKKLRSDFKPIMKRIIERMVRKLPALPNFDEMNLKLFGNSSKSYNNSLVEGRTSKVLILFGVFSTIFV